MYSNKEILRNWLMILYSFLFPLELWAALPQKAIEIKMRERPLVVEDSVRLVDVAEIYAKSLSQFESLSQLVVAQFPADQERLRIPGSYLRQRISEVIGANADANIQIPEWLEIAKFKEQITDLSIIAAIEKLARSEAKIPEGIEAKISLAHVPPEVFFKSSKNFLLSPANQNSSWRGDTTFKLELGDNKIYWIRTQIRWFAQRWVAKRDIRAWENLNADDFIQRNVEVTNISQDAVLSENTESLSASLQGVRSKRFLATNSILQKNFLDKKPDIQAGSPVRVSFVAESGLRILAEGSALASGSVGDLLKARLSKSKKIISGRLQQNGLVEVSL